MAETFTDKLKLSKRDTGDLNWGAGHNANMDVLDAHHQQSNLRPPRTLLASLGSGAVGANLLGSTTYFFKVTAFNAAGETTECLVPSLVEAQIVEPSTPVPIILQWETVKGASGYRIYKGTTSGQEKLLTELTGESTLTYTDAGSVASNPAISVPAQNTARTSVKKIVAGTGIAVSPTDGTGDVTISSTVTGGVSSLKKTGAASLQGDISLEEGAGVSLTQDDVNKKITLANGGVTGIRKLGDASPLIGDVKLEAGTNITLLTDAPNNKITIVAAGGGAAGYASAVVAAPTGVAATDNANVQNALNAVGSLGGGIVQLREGTYVIINTLSMPSRVTLQGQGPYATTIRADNAMGYIGLLSASGYNVLRDLTLDGNQQGRIAGNCNTEVTFDGGNTPMLIENIIYINNYGFNIMVKMSDKGVMRNCKLYNNGTYIADSMVYHGEQIEGCYFQRDQINSFNNVINGARRVINNQYYTTIGSQFNGYGIVTLNQAVIIGNTFQLGSSYKFISLASDRNTVIGNYANGGQIVLQSGVQNNTVVGNAYVTITNNSGNSTNQIAYNT